MSIRLNFFYKNFNNSLEKEKMLWYNFNILRRRSTQKMKNAISLVAVHTSNFIKINEGEQAFIKDMIKDRLCYVKSI